MRSFLKRLPKNKTLLLYYLTASLSLVGAMLLSLLLGSTRLDLLALMRAVFGGDMTSAELRIFLYVRLPRTLSSVLAGAALSVGGCVIQGVLRNRLASPSLIGVNAGAGLAVTVAAALGIVGGFLTSLFSFLGAFLAVMLIALMSKRWELSRGGVILCGVAVNSFFNAISSTLVTLFPELGVMSNDFKIGDFSAVSYRTLFPCAIMILACLALLFTLPNELDVISLGEESAKGLGMNTQHTRILFLVLCAALSGAAVSLGGLLSFVGLIVPHTVRLLGVHRSSHLMPLCALVGGAFVCVCDLLSRTVFSPYEVPVGILMAFVGAPFFIFLLLRGREEKNDA